MVTEFYNLFRVFILGEIQVYQGSRENKETIVVLEEKGKFCMKLGIGLMMLGYALSVTLSMYKHFRTQGEAKQSSFFAANLILQSLFISLR
ncbi:hypothetical protein AX774_g5479 [Zancudomyces culisetae]|uniref:Uncharacterized protein n=1 Tax=Zancudomyces culisetae TaxID=1213189 RepID=A0A1R1PJ87_ZANCU|nr:hypothetical protein AX774_g5479 [Zancudomyces culisetae]|eukprot:OMH81065.1 hypothetical protein AX774_g5479 [Zancudomyces culisetae]